MRICSRCEAEKPSSEFWRNKRECKDCSKQRRREWGAKNRDKESAYNRAAYQANPEPRKAQAKRWREENPERYAERHRDKEAARRARKHEAFVEPVKASVLFERDGAICGICAEALGDDYHIDHVIPLVKGGMHSYANTQLAHPSCNMSKGGR